MDNYNVGPAVIDSCNTAFSCGGATISLISTGTTAQIRECCVETAGLSYSILGQCTDCVGKGIELISDCISYVHIIL